MEVRMVMSRVMVLLWNHLGLWRFNQCEPRYRRTRMATSWRVNGSRGEESQKNTPAVAMIRRMVWSKNRAGIVFSLARI